MKSFIFSCVIILICIIFVVLFCEVFLRYLGHETWSYTDVSDEPVILVQDSELGWTNINKPITFPAFTPKMNDIQMTFLDDRSRITSFEDHSGQPEIVVVGGSYSQGWALSDDETYTWKLQQMFPEVKITNHGTGAFGTYQCLMNLKRIYANSNPPDFVIYSFIEHHEDRNVATPEWLKLLAGLSTRGHINVPYCTINENNELIECPAVTYPGGFFREYLVSANYFQLRYLKYKARKRIHQKRPVTERLILEIKELCEDQGSEFIMVLLSCYRTDEKIIKEYYQKFCLKQGIHCIDCVIDYNNMGSDMKVPGDGHPNGKVNTLWADCIAEKLNQILH